MTRVGRGGAGAEEVTQFSRNFLGMRLSGAWNDKDFKYLEYLRTFITHATLIGIIALRELKSKNNFYHVCCEDSGYCTSYPVFMCRATVRALFLG